MLVCRVACGVQLTRLRSRNVEMCLLSTPLVSLSFCLLGVQWAEEVMVSSGNEQSLVECNQSRVAPLCRNVCLSSLWVQLCNPSSVPVTSEQIWRSTPICCSNSRGRIEKMTIVIESAPPSTRSASVPSAAAAAWRRARPICKMGPPGNLEGNYFRE